MSKVLEALQMASLNALRELAYEIASNDLTDGSAILSRLAAAGATRQELDGEVKRAETILKVRSLRSQAESMQPEVDRLIAASKQANADMEALAVRHAAELAAAQEAQRVASSAEGQTSQRQMHLVNEARRLELQLSAPATAEEVRVANKRQAATALAMHEADHAARLDQARKERAAVAARAEAERSKVKTATSA